jgi:hypothetical protein
MRRRCSWKRSPIVEETRCEARATDVKAKRWKGKERKGKGIAVHTLAGRDRGYGTCACRWQLRGQLLSKTTWLLEEAEANLCGDRNGGREAEASAYLCACVCVLRAGSRAYDFNRNGSLLT